MRTTPALVYTEDPGGGNRIFLDRLVPNELSTVTGLQWTTTYPGGDSSWSCGLNADPNLSHLGLNLGRQVTIVKGGAIRFQGKLATAARGVPWQLQGPGAFSVAITSAGSGGFIAVAPTSGNAYNLDEIISNAQTRGLQWTVPTPLPGSLSIPTAGTAASGSCDLDTAFGTVGKALGLVVSLSPLQAVTMAAPPTTARYVLRPQQALTPTLAGFTQAVGLYSGGVLLASNPAAQAKWGNLEGVYDMTSLEGTTPLDATTAGNYLSNWLTANLAYPTYTSTLTVQTGQLRVVHGTAMGGPVDLSTVRAGHLIDVYDINPDHSHLLAPGPLQILTGQTSYDDDTDTLTVTPVGAIGTDLLAALYAGQGGAL
ncbi:MAG TPA: hypothetical protein VIJ31_12205 [Acidothermaceae bacterium]